MESREFYDVCLTYFALKLFTDYFGFYDLQIAACRPQKIKRPWCILDHAVDLTLVIAFVRSSHYLVTIHSHDRVTFNAMTKAHIVLQSARNKIKLTLVDWTNCEAGVQGVVAQPP